MADVLFYDGAQLIDAQHPLAFGPLNTDASEVSAWKAVTVKMAEGLVSSGDLTIDVAGVSDTKFQLATNINAPAAYGASITISDVDDTTGVVIYVRAKAENEAAANDPSCSLTASGEAIAA